jgi:hypothetical protein
VVSDPTPKWLTWEWQDNTILWPICSVTNWPGTTMEQWSRIGLKVLCVQFCYASIFVLLKRSPLTHAYTQLPPTVWAVIHYVYIDSTMDGSESDIPNVDLDIMSTLSADMNQWIGFFKAETVCKTHQEITKERLMNQSKETLANCNERIPDDSIPC